MTIDHSAYTGIFAAVNNISKVSAITNDKDNNGKMTFDEYGVNKDLFNSLDKNGDGALTVSEIGNALLSKMEEYSDKKEAISEKETKSEETEKFTQLLQETIDNNSSSEIAYDSLNESITTDSNESNSTNSLLSSNSTSTNATKMFLASLGMSTQTSTISI